MILPIIGFGLYNAFKLVIDRNKLAKNGRLTIALIKTTSKGKCGLGYGYSATFTYEVNGNILVGNCECESRAWVKPGEQYLVAYNPVQPEKVHLFADSLIAARRADQSQ